MSKIGIAISLVYLILAAPSATAQHCVHKASDEIIAHFNKSKKNKVSTRTKDYFRIPIVFHILYTRAEENVPDSILDEQLEILNKDFAGETRGTQAHREIFNDVKGEAKIEFYIANVIRKEIKEQVPSPIFATDQMDVYKYSEKGSAALNPDKFLNVWVCEFEPVLGGLGIVGGHAYSPQQLSSSKYPEEVDGVMLDWRTLGADKLVKIPNALFTIEVPFEGHTLTHEIGHYLGLAHTYGHKADGACGDDGIDDTPKTGFEVSCMNSENPCPEESLPPMYENFMSASAEPCQDMFTIQQVELMRFVLKEYRCTLIDACAKEEETETAFGVFPNPVSNTLYIQGDAEAVDIYSLDGQKLIESIPNANQVDVSELKPGLYIVAVRIAAKVNRLRLLKL